MTHNSTSDRTPGAALSRRRLLAVSASVAGSALAVAGLAGCGFALRKPPIFAFKSIAIPGNSAFINYLRRNLGSTGTVQVIPADRQREADVILDILGEERTRYVLSTNAAGEVRELELRYRLRFRLRTPAGKELLLSEIAQKRDLTYNETNALAKEGESELLYRDMQNDIAQQMLRRLAAVKEL
ncbi:MAG: Rare lipoprotein [Variovorax sp.]|nr:Rare lipoprotein [Variovorax sp.]